MFLRATFGIAFVFGAKMRSGMKARVALAHVVTIAVFFAAASACSLFVSLDGIDDGDASIASSSDASIDQNTTDANLADASAPDADAATSKYASVILADTPLAYFHLDEASGTTLADSSGNGHDATTTSVLLGVAGAFPGSGLAAHFDGTAFATITDSVSDAGTAFDFANVSAFSLEAWVKFDHLPNEDAGEEFTFLSKEQHINNGYHGIDFFVRPQIILQREDDPTSETETPLLAGLPDATSWHYVLATYDGSTINVFIDNVAAGTKTGATNAIEITSVPFLLGSEDVMTDEALIGSMDEVAIYTTALTLTQRTAHFAAAK